MSPSDARILVIDDEPMLRKNVADLLGDSGYQTLTAGDGREGIDLFRREQPDLVLLDLRMPEMDGFQVLEKITAEHPDTPVIVVSGVGVIQDAMRAVRLGAWDFITKPVIDFDVLLHAVDKALERSRLRVENRRYREHLESEVRSRTAELREEMRRRREAQEALQRLDKEIIDSQKELIIILGDVVESRSQETANHVRRVAEYTYILAELSGVSPEDAAVLRMAAPMHDIGKIGIPDAVLNKPGRLTPEEFEIIKTHTTIGHNLLRLSERRIMKVAAVVAHEHHEHWDGSGYPRGLAGEDIHLYGRIVAVADVFDALTHDRVYKKAWPLEETLPYIRAGSGKQFDPGLIDLFEANVDRFLHVKELYPDRPML